MTHPLPVGIDLGTTNTVVAFADANGTPRVFDISQWVTAAEREALPLLPSALYAPLPAELAAEAEPAPWIVGSFARRRGQEVPGRLIASAKSWLSYGAVDRSAAILPWGAQGDEITPLSPIEASERVLAHVRDAWNSAFSERPLRDQPIVLTVPASFDEVARELTVRAAERAGLTVRLLEEPQAAFYDFWARVGNAGLERLLLGERERAEVLVCDVGGGTTDLTLIEVRRDGQEIVVNRLAVGRHLLLGGDNVDLALAYQAERALVAAPARLEPARFNQLILACREAKERLLSPAAPDSVAITIAGTGSALVGSTLSTRLSREVVEALVFDGFLPLVPRDAVPARGRSGLVAFGLPYEQDAAITRHVAQFFARHSERPAPDALLLNGGLFRAARAAERLRDCISGWGETRVTLLPAPEPDLAVARGAVVYGLALAGRGLRIGGGAAHGFYVAVDVAGERRALCVVPRGAREGERHVAKSRGLALRVGQPVRFDLFAVDSRELHAPGAVVDIDEDRFSALPPVTTQIAAGAEQSEREIPVALEGELSAVGTVDLACVELEPRSDAPRRFRLAFDLRAKPRERASERAAPASAPAAADKRVEQAEAVLLRVFGKGRSDVKAREVKDCWRELERILGERRSWSAETNRALFDVLAPHHAARRRSEDHERIFWMLAGFCLRPGLGHPNDPRRVALLAPLFEAGLAFPESARSWQQFFIAFRRIAAGLDEAAQSTLRALLDPFLAPAELKLKKPKQFRAQAADEMLELAARLERVAPERRMELGAWILERTWSSRDPRNWALLGRVGARVPGYASVHHVVPPLAVERWLDHLLRERWQDVPTAAPAAAQLARLTGDRARDVNDALRAEVLARLAAIQAAPELIRVVSELVEVAEAERAAWFEDDLPVGLRLHAENQ